MAKRQEKPATSKGERRRSKKKEVVLQPHGNWNGGKQKWNQNIGGTHEKVPYIKSENM